MKRNKEDLSLRKLQQFAGHAVKNGIRLHFESLALLQWKCYPTAFFLSVLAMEELGKGFAADFFAWNSKIHTRDTAELQHQWLNALLTDHRKKQLAFLRESLIYIKDIPKTFATVESRRLDIAKQNAMYVGLKKPASGKRTDEKFILPAVTTKRPQAKQQVQQIHNFLLDTTKGTLEGRIWHDLKTFRILFNARLYNALSEFKL